MRNLGTLLIILLAFLLAAQLRFDSVTLGTLYIYALLTGLLLSAVIIPATGAFRDEFRWEFFRKFRRMLAGWAVVVMCMIAIAAMLKTTADYSRIWFGTWVLLTALGLFLSQLLEHAWLLRQRATGKLVKSVILVGGGENAARLDRRIENDKFQQIEIVGRFGDQWNNEDCQPLEQLRARVADQAAAEVWIAAPWDDHGLLKRSLDALRESVVDITVIPDLHQYRLLNHDITEWAGLPLVSLSGTPMTGTEMRIKSFFDRVLAGLILLLLLPFLFIIGLLIKLTSPGPVLFRQQRHGMGGESIQVLKFRTMKEHQERAGQVTQAHENDERITRVGYFLRRTSLDELPQFWNVMRGEMSLVGPRPHPVEHNELYKSQIPRYMVRHKVKPGITGWAQVHGLRGITDTPEKMSLRIEHDLWYIRNWSLTLDFKILLMTPLAMIHRNAI